MLHPLRAFALSAVALAGAAFVPAQDRPNILLIVADDLGIADLGCYRGEDGPPSIHETPHLDRLAAQGMRFTDGYATCPVCSPSRYSLMTGRLPARAPLTDWLKGQRRARFAPATYDDRLGAEEITVAEALRERGYATFFAGKWHLGPDETDWPEHHGFDTNKGGWARGGPYGPGKYFVPYGNPRLEDGPEGEYLPLRLADETAHWIEERQRQEPDKPWFATLSFYSVHTPLVARPERVEAFRRKREELAATVTGPRFAPEEQVWPTDRPRRVRIVQDHAVYAAMLEGMDEAAGRLLAALDRLGVADSTLVVFTSDNGGLSTSEGSPTSNLPYRGGKGWSYEGGIREPFLVRWPGVTEPGSTCTVPVTGADLFPTFLAAAGAPLPTDRPLDGSDLRGLCDGPADAPGPPADRPLVWHYPHYGNQGGFPAGVLRRGPWKLILRYEDGRHHLYDLSTDPAERADLAARLPERAAALRAELLQRLAAMDARFLRPVEDGPAPWQPDGSSQDR